MEIELIERPTFDLKIGDTTLPGFSVTSEWEGFKKLSSAKYGVAILAMPQKGEYPNLLSWLTPEAKGAPVKVSIIKASQVILTAIEDEERARLAKENLSKAAPPGADTVHHPV